MGVERGGHLHLSGKDISTVKLPGWRVYAVLSNNLPVVTL